MKGLSSRRHQLPDRQTHNFGASKSLDRRILCSSETPIRWFLGSKIVNVSAGQTIAPAYNVNIVLYSEMKEGLVSFSWIKKSQNDSWSITLLNVSYFQDLKSRWSISSEMHRIRQFMDFEALFLQSPLRQSDNLKYLTEHFTILTPQIPEIDKVTFVQKRRLTDDIGLKLWNV